MKKRFLFAGTAAFVLLTSFCLLLLIPYICDAILPSLLQKLPFEGKNIQISRITPWKTVGHFNITDKKSKFSSARFEIHYSPAKLYDGTIDTIILDGAFIELAPELFSSTKKSQTKVNDTSDLFSELPIIVERIIVSDMTIILRTKDNLAQSFHIDGTVDLSSTKQNKKYQLEQIHTEAATKGSLHSNITSTLEIKNQSHFLNTDILIKKIDLPQSFGLPPFTGEIYSSSSISLDKKFENILNIELDATSSNFDLIFDNMAVSARQNVPLQIKVNGTPKKLSYDFKGIAINTPFTTIHTSGSGDIYLENLDLTSQTTLTMPEFDQPITANFNKNGNKFDLTLNGEGLQLQNIHLEHSPITLQLSGTIVGDQIQANLHAAANNLKFTEHNISISRLTFDQPLHIINNQLQPTNGSFAIKNISYNKAKLAKISGKTNIDNSVQSFTANIKSPLHTKMAINCGGSYQPNEETSFSVNCNLNDIVISENNLPSFVTIPDDLTFNAQLGADLLVKFNKSLQAELQTRIKDTTINSGDKTTITGLSTNFTLPYLPMQQSLPSQNLHISEINIGTIKLTDADITYRLEDFKTFFIEQSRFNWCGGKVESGSIRIASDKDEYNLTLYCDRIGFTELLGQLGMPNAEGEGTLNGRLPISLNGTTLYFDDGFLFSSPGDSGIVRFTNTESIKNNLGTSVGSSYLDYSMSSLENFKYNWATLSFNSVEDNLTISMQLDGKPAEPLPFTYKDGQLVPSDKGMGIQHPIHLDVNFHLPLTDLLHYGRNIQSLMESM